MCNKALIPSLKTYIDDCQFDREMACVNRENNGWLPLPFHTVHGNMIEERRTYFFTLLTDIDFILIIYTSIKPILSSFLSFLK